MIESDKKLINTANSLGEKIDESVWNQLFRADEMNARMVLHSIVERAREAKGLMTMDLLMKKINRQN
ncbi:hypothetical protein [Reichenbachiella sp.]|uniref:hypothetical protein n=1 Tax=Reichenbachiella sp. TaxID=2184521 RepID=UPI003BB0084B